jgi:hypothetical protein
MYCDLVAGLSCNLNLVEVIVEKICFFLVDHLLGTMFIYYRFIVLKASLGFAPIDIPHEHDPVPCITNIDRLGQHV